MKRTYIVGIAALLACRGGGSEKAADVSSPAMTTITAPPPPPTAPAPRGPRPSAWVVPGYNPDAFELSADGRWVGIVDEHGEARVLDGATGEEVFRLPGDEALDLAFAGNALVVLTRHWEQGKPAVATLHHVDVPARKVVAAESGKAEGMISPCGDGVVVRLDDEKGRTLSLRTPLAAAWTVEGTFGEIACGGDLVAAANREGVALFERTTGKPRGQIAVPFAKDDYVFGLVVDRAGARIAMASHRGDVRIWSADGTLIASRPGAGAGRAIDFSPDGRLLALGSALVDPASLAFHTRNHGVMHEPDLVRFAPDGAHVVWAGTYAAVPHEVRALLAAVRQEGPESGIRSLAVEPGGGFAAIGTEDGRVFFQDLESGEIRRVIDAHRDDVNGLVFLSKDRLLTGGADEALHEWDVATGARVRSIDVPESVQIEDVRLSANGKRILVRGWDRVTVFERDGKRVRVFGPFPGKGTSNGASVSAGADIDPKGEHVAITLDRSRTVVLRVSDGVEILAVKRDSTEDFGVTHPLFTNDGSALLVGDRGGTTLHRVADGSIVRAWKDFFVDEGQFSPDGKQLFFYSWGGEVGILPLEGKSARRKSAETGDENPDPSLWREHAPWHVGGAAWDPKRPLVWTGGPDIALTGWDRATGKRVKTLSGAIGDHVETLAFSSDGTRVIAAHERRISIWDRRTHSLVVQREHDQDDFGFPQAFELEGTKLRAIDGAGNVLTWEHASNTPPSVTLLEEPFDGGIAALGGRWEIYADEYSGSALVRPRGSNKAGPVLSFDENSMGDVEGIALDAERGRIATAHVFPDEDGEKARVEIRLRDATGKILLRRDALEVPAMQFDPGGRLLVSWYGGERNAGEWWTIGKPTRVEKWDIEPRAQHALVMSPYFSPDGKRLAYLHDDVVWIVSVAGKLERIIAPRSNGVLEQIAWSPDGSSIAVGSRHEGDIRVYDVASGAWLATYRLRKDGSARICTPETNQGKRTSTGMPGFTRC